jgi:hypothetical protein
MNKPAFCQGIFSAYRAENARVNSSENHFSPARSIGTGLVRGPNERISVGAPRRRQLDRRWGQLVFNICAQGGGWRRKLIQVNRGTEANARSIIPGPGYADENATTA